MRLGNVYVAPVAEGVSFNPAIHRSLDFVVRQVRISESEGDFPIAEIEVENSGQRPGRVFISIDTLDDAGAVTGTVLMFDGRLDGWPIGPAGAFVTLRYLARRLDWETRRNNVLATFRQLPFQDPLFGDLSDPVEALDALPVKVHWDRANGLPVMSSIVSGPLYIDLGSAWRRDSLQLDMIGRPLAAVDVVVTAEWESRELIEFSLANLFFAAGGNWGMSTLTPQAVFEDWPRPGDTVGGGYVVTASGLGVRGTPNNAPASYSFQQAGNEKKSYKPGDNAPIPMTFPVTYLNPAITVIGARSIARRETISFRLLNGGQAAGIGDIEKIEMSLSGLALDPLSPEWQSDTFYGVGAAVTFAGYLWQCNIAHVSTSSLWSDLRAPNGAARWSLSFQWGAALPSPAADQFFVSDRGAQAVDHAVLVAMTKIAASQRCVEAKVECDLADALHIRCAAEVRLEGPDIPGGGELFGKVTSYTITLADGLSDLEITLGCSAGSGLAGGFVSGQFGRNVQLFSDAVSTRVGYLANSGDFVGPGWPQLRIGIENNGPVQAAALEAGAHPNGTDDLANLLQSRPTRVIFDSGPLDGSETERNFSIQPTAYQGFRQVNI